MANRTASDLETHYERQLSFLSRSADAFDAGFEDEALRIAHTLRILFHQTKLSHSVVSQLGLDLKIIDTSGPIIANTSLLQVRGAAIGGAPNYVAPLSDADRKFPIPFPNWWQQVVLRKEGNTFSRRRLTLQLANKEGGSHVDPKLTEAFEEMRENFGFASYLGDVEFEMKDHISLTMRQIAHEVLESCVDGYSRHPEKVGSGMAMTIQAGGMDFIKQPTPERNDLCPCESGLKFKKCHRLGDGFWQRMMR